MKNGLVLSATQKRIINHDRGHLRIIACPGSGKTETVSRRVAELIKKGIKPSIIVAFTFTEKAANELKLRIRRILEEQCPDKSDFGDMYVGTIDSFCLHMLKQLKPEYKSFEVLDSARRTAFVDRWYYKMDFKRMETDAQGKWRTIEKFCNSADRVMTERVDVQQISTISFVDCYEKYRAKLKEERFFDFTSIIYTLLDVLTHDNNALLQLNKTVKHVVFDEYQDVNQLQEELLGFLSKGADSICVVGDDDQNIFQWRGSNVKHIVDFPKRYHLHNVTTEKLNVNYRATEGLVKVANQLIRYNTTRIEKDMQASTKSQIRKFENGDIIYNHFNTDKDEFEFILKNIHNLKNTDFIDKYGNTYALSYQDMAVIVKTNEDAARIIKFFDQNNVPCVADSGSSVFDRPIVSLATNCICYVFDCIGYNTEHQIPQLHALVQKYRETVVKGDSELFQKNLKQVKKRTDKIIDKGHSDWLPGLGLQEFFQRILSAMGAENKVFDEIDLYHLGVLSRVISDYEYVYQTLRARQISGLTWFITQYAENSYSDPVHNDPTLVDAIRVLTIWKAKGLEFPIVFVPTFVKRNRPPRRDYFVDDELYERSRYDGNTEDDRRAYYTAITRSKKYLFLTGASRREIVVDTSTSKRTIYPHPFIEELRNDKVLLLSSPYDIPKKPKSKNKTQIQYEGTFPTSYSELSIYDRCPYDYKLRHILGFNAGVPMAFGYGTNVHNVLNVIHTDFIQNQTIPSDNEIDQIVDRMFYLRFAPGDQNENMKKAGGKVIKNYVNLHKDDFERILETEKRFEFTMGKALISGDIDLLKKVNEKDEITEVEIIDFKTDKQKEDGMYDLDYSEQARFYSYAVSASLGFKPKKALVHHLDTHEKNYVDISDTKLAETAKRIESRVDSITSKSFDAVPNDKKCQGCDFRAICSNKGFYVGVDFKPVESAKRDAPVRIDDDYSGMNTQINSQKHHTLKPSIISSNVQTQAKKIASKLTQKNKDGSFNIQSRSDPMTLYIVTESNCQCTGFRQYNARYPGHIATCSHIEAVKIFKSKQD